MADYQSRKGSTSHLTSPCDFRRSELLHGGRVDWFGINSVDRKSRSVSTKPSSKRHQQHPDIIIIDDENPVTAFNYENAEIPFYGAQRSVEDSISRRKGQEAQHDVKLVDSMSGAHGVQVASREHRVFDSRVRSKELKFLLAEMKEKRMSVIAKRLQIREEREALRATRHDTIELAAQLVTELKAFFATEIPQRVKSLQAAFERLQSAGDNYLPKEDDYNTLEGGVNSEEWELRELESKVYRTLEDLHHGVVVDNENETDDTADQRSESSSLPSRYSAYPPMLHELLSTLGDVDLVKEQLADLRSQRAYIVEQQKVLVSAGRGLTQSHLEFLASFNSKHEELQRQIFELETDVDRLRGAWENEGLKKQELDATEETINLDDLPSPHLDPLLADQVSSISDRLSLTKGQELAGQGTQHSGVRPHFEELRNGNSVGVLTYINQWFLWRLRRSSLDIKRYKSEPTLDGLRGKEPYLSNLILEHWYDDSVTGLLNDPTRIPRSLTIVTGRNIGRDGISRSKSSTKSDSVVLALNRLTLQLHGFTHSPIQQRTHVDEPETSVRRASAPDITFVSSRHTLNMGASIPPPH